MVEFFFLPLSHPVATKEVNATGKSFTVRSSLQFQVDRRDDGIAYTCSVEHVSLLNPYMTTEVLEVHCECHGYTPGNEDRFLIMLEKKQPYEDWDYNNDHLCRISVGLVSDWWGINFKIEQGAG